MFLHSLFSSLSTEVNTKALSFVSFLQACILNFPTICLQLIHFLAKYFLVQVTLGVILLIIIYSLHVFLFMNLSTYPFSSLTLLLSVSTHSLSFLFQNFSTFHFIPFSFLSGISWFFFYFCVIITSISLLRLIISFTATCTLNGLL